MFLFNSTPYCWSWVSPARCCGSPPGWWPWRWRRTWCRTGARARCSGSAWCWAQSSSCRQSCTNLPSPERRNTEIQTRDREALCGPRASFGISHQEQEPIRAKRAWRSRPQDSLNEVALQLGGVRSPERPRQKAINCSIEYVVTLFGQSIQIGRRSFRGSEIISAPTEMFFHISFPWHCFVFCQHPIMPRSRDGDLLRCCSDAKLRSFMSRTPSVRLPLCKQNAGRPPPDLLTTLHWLVKMAYWSSYDTTENSSSDVQWTVMVS